MALTKVGGDVIQNPLNVGIITATRIDGNVSGDVNSTGVSTFTTLKVGTGVTISGGIVTATTFSGALTGNVTGNATGLSGTPNITVGSIIASSATISGNVSVAGTLTYEDVTNVDSVGLVTARTGVRIDAGGLVVVGVTTVAAGSVSAPSITPTGDSDTGIFFPSADTIALVEGGSEAVRIDSSGRVGIGLTNPSEKLQVVGKIIASSTIRAGTTAAIASSGEFLSVLGQATIRLDSSTSAVTYLINADTTASTIQPFLLCNDTGGNRSGIGVEYSSAIASFYGHLGISLQTGSTAFGYANERLRITSSGDVGIGTNNPLSTLHIRHESNDPYIYIQRNTTGATDIGGVIIRNANTNIAQIVGRADASNGGMLQFWTTASGTSAERLRIDSSGNVTINNGNLVIGTSGKGIDFSANANASGMTSELLDDYEEGTWTPVLSSTGATITQTNYGHYTKIGDLVTAYCYCAVTALSGTTSNSARLTGLPFSTISSTNSFASGTVGQWYYTGWRANAKMLTTYLDVSGNQAQLAWVFDSTAEGYVTAAELKPTGTTSGIMFSYTYKAA